MGMLAPSMMCAQIDKLDETLRAFEKAGIEYLHIDVMDGCFVPNLMLGTDYVKQLRKLTSIPLDIHLMITEPEKKISWFDFQPGEFVSVHTMKAPRTGGRPCKWCAMRARSPWRPSIPPRPYRCWRM